MNLASRWNPSFGAVLGWLDDVAQQADEASAILLVGAARDRAWNFATHLANAPPTERETLVKQQEHATARLSEALLVEVPGVARLGSTETPSVAEIIRFLADDDCM